MKIHFTFNAGRNVLLFVLCLLVVFFAASGFCSRGPVPPASGESLYRKNCMRCHGVDGTRGLLGAKNLRRSSLASEAIRTQIQTGKGFMPSFRKKLNEAEIEELVLYVRTLRAAGDK